MDDAFLMRVLDRVAGLNQQFETIIGGKLVLVAVVGDFDAADEFHDEVGTAGFSRARVENFGDVWMIHHREGLALCFETGDDTPGVHAELDDFESDASADWFLLLSHINNAATTFAELLEKFVAADFVAGLFSNGKCNR